MTHFGLRDKQTKGAFLHEELGHPEGGSSRAAAPPVEEPGLLAFGLRQQHKLPSF